MDYVFHEVKDWGEVVVYKITQDEIYYSSKLDFTEIDKRELNELSHPKRRLQWLASRYILKSISKEKRTLYLTKSKKGKPNFTNVSSHFSLSHSGDFVAVIFSKNKKVAIDLEGISEKVIRVKHKFLHPLDFEQESDKLNLTLIWSAKETIYKYFDSHLLISFKENISISEKTKDKLEFTLISISQLTHSILYYHKVEDIVLTYLVEN